MPIRRALALLTLLVAPARAIAADATISVTVTPVIAPRFPALTSTETATVLSTASEMIRRGYARDVRFSLSSKEDNATFFAERRKTYAPFAPPADLCHDPADRNLGRYVAAAESACKTFGSLEEIHALLPAGTAPFKTRHDAAVALLKQYGRRLWLLQNLPAADGNPVLTEVSWPSYSLTYWNLYFAARAARPEINLYLSNAILLDDAIGDPAPHTLVSAVANGVSYPVTNCCVVAYYQWLRGDDILRTDRFGPLTHSQRLTVIAFVIAHEVGTHLVMGLCDDYSAQAGLARPPQSQPDRSFILSYKTWPVAPPHATRIDPREFHYSIARWRILIALARHDRTSAEDELARAGNMGLTDDQFFDLAELFAPATRPAGK